MTFVSCFHLIAAKSTLEGKQPEAIGKLGCSGCENLSSSGTNQHPRSHDDDRCHRECGDVDRTIRQRLPASAKALGRRHPRGNQVLPHQEPSFLAKHLSSACRNCTQQGADISADFTRITSCYWDCIADERTQKVVKQNRTPPREHFGTLSWKRFAPAIVSKSEQST